MCTWPEKRKSRLRGDLKQPIEKITALARTVPQSIHKIHTCLRPNPTLLLRIRPYWSIPMTPLRDPRLFGVVDLRHIALSDGAGCSEINHPSVVLLPLRYDSVSVVSPAGVIFLVGTFPCSLAAEPCRAIQEEHPNVWIKDWR